MRTRHLTSLLLLPIVARTLQVNGPSHIVSITSYYISPNGSDVSGDGTQRNPWATPAYAADQVRPLLPSQSSNVQIILLGGTYRLNSTFVLTPEDSGRNGYIVSYAADAASSEVPYLDGGVLVDPAAWKPLLNATPNGGEVWAASLPSAMKTARQFWVGLGGVDRVNESVAVNVNLTSKDTVLLQTGYLTSNSALLSLIESSPENVLFPEDIEFLYTSRAAQWQEARARVAAWERPSDENCAAMNASVPCLNISMAQPGWMLVTHKGYPEQLPSALTNFVSQLRPGQGFVSSRLGLVYAPRDGERMSELEVVVAALDAPLLSLQGNRSTHAMVRNIAIEGLGFRHAAWLAPTIDGGYAPDQGGIGYAPVDLPPPLSAHGTHPVPSALRLSSAANVTVTDCIITHVGGTALATEDGSQDITVAGSLVLDAGCSAFRIGQVDDIDESDPSRLNSRVRLVNNFAFGVAAEFRDCSGIFGGFITNSTIEHNTLLNTSWAGLTVGWMGWGKGVIRPSLGGNRILSNRIEYVNLVTGDGGPIYVMAPQPSRANCSNLELSCYSEIGYNYVGYALHHAAMLYHDEGSAFFHTHDNAVLQPLLTDPHGWWWSYLAAWAESEWDILMAGNTAIGVNRSDIAQGPLNLTVVNSTLLPWGSAWPPAAQAIVDSAGVFPETAKYCRR